MTDHKIVLYPITRMLNCSACQFGGCVAERNADRWMTR